MKPALFLFICLLPLFLRADDTIQPGDEDPPTLTPDKFVKEYGVAPKDGILVKLKFDSRGEDVIDAEEKDCRQAAISSRYQDDAHPGGNVDVIIPPEALSWFRHIPTSVSDDTINVKTFIVYGRTQVDKEGRIYVKLVGNEIQHNDIGPSTIIWHGGDSN